MVSPGRAQIYRLAQRHIAIAGIPLEHQDLVDVIRGADITQVHAMIRQHIIGTATQLLEAEPSTPADTVMHYIR